MDDGSEFFHKYNFKDWEKFCERMLRHEIGQENFYVVPDEDGGDYGIEFFSSTGIIFQCYFPKLDIDIKTWKKSVQEKIREDLPKLKFYESKLEPIIGDIVVTQWILLTPKNLSKNILRYCNEKKKLFLEDPPSFIDKNNFKVRLETAETYPTSKVYALSCSPKKIDIKIIEPSVEVQNNWVQAYQENDTKFLDNISRKSINLMGGKADEFQERVIAKYIQMDRFLENLRVNFPDQYTLVEDTARALLMNIKDLAVIENIDSDFIKKVLTKNQESFKKYSESMSDSNLSLLSFGYISKWIAECNMDFK